MRIIPAIDLIDGACVRLTQGAFDSRKVYNSDPVAVARDFEEQGAEYLHVVDLDGAKAGKVVHAAVIEAICRNTKLKVDIGGGIQSADDIRRALDSGASQVNLGSAAVKHPEKFSEWLHEFGAERLILSADVRAGVVMVKGWQEGSGILLNDLITGFLPAGLLYVVTTDIVRDGAMLGPATALYEQLLADFPTLKIVASGGVSSLSDLAILRETGVDGAIVGKALYEGVFTLSQALKA